MKGGQPVTADPADDPLESISIDLDADEPAEAAPVQAPLAAAPAHAEHESLPELDLAAVSAAPAHADHESLPELDLSAVSAHAAPAGDTALPKQDLSAVSATDPGELPHFDLSAISAAAPQGAAPLPDGAEPHPDFDLSASAAAPATANHAEPLPDFDLSAVSAASQPALQTPATPAKASAYNPEAMWPGNVPTVEVALAFLRGEQPVPEAFAGAKKIQDTMTQPDRDAIREDGLSPELRAGTLLRWRLAAALDLLPAAQGQLDQAGLDALLAEVDQTLATLREAVSATPELALAVDRACERLTTEALAFSNKVKSAPTAAAASTTAPGATKRAAAAGKVTFTRSKEETSERRPKLLYVAFALVVLVVGAYHVSNLLRSATPDVPTVPGAPPQTAVLLDAKTGMMRVMTNAPGGAVTPEQKTWLKQQEAKGMQVREVGPGTFMVLPAPPPPQQPATAGPVTP